MTTLTLNKNDKPIKAPTKEVVVNGMTVTVGEPPFEIEADFELVLGDNASNTAWVRKQYPYLWVRTIDGENVWPIVHFSEFKVLRNRLGREGYSSVLQAVSELLEAQEGKAKNLQSIPSSGDAAA